MKRLFSALFVFLIMGFTFVLVGCNDRYGGLSMSLSFSFSPNGENVEVLDDGTYRVITGGGVFDAKRDGSYVIYIGEENARIPLDIVYHNAPDDFNYDVNFSYNSEAFTCDKSDKNFITNGIQVTVVASSIGKGNLTVINSEANIKSSIYIEVVKIANEISFKNSSLGISVEERSIINFANELTGIPQGQNFEISFGTGSVENFSPMTYEELMTKGFNYNINTKSLSLARTTNIELDSFLVKATYTSPLGEELVAYATIDVLPALSGFEIYLGSDIDSVLPENRVDLNSALEFVYNNVDGRLNYKDFIFKINSNGEKVTFGAIYEEGLYPFKVGENILTPQPLFNKSPYVYVNQNGQVVDDYSQATTTYGFFRLEAIKSTEDPKYTNSIYTINFTCDYADYEITNYPLVLNVDSTIFSLVETFEINGDSVDSTFFEKGELAGSIDSIIDKFYQNKLYLNTSGDISGESFEISVASPSNINEQNSKFYVEFYDDNYNLIADPSYYLTISYEYAGNSYNYVSSDNQLFSKDTTFYIKPKRETTSANDQFFMIIRAEKPTDMPAVAGLHFVVVEGISEIESYDYTNYTYSVNEETGEYILDEFGNKIIVNSGSEGVLFTESTSSSKTMVGVETINVDLNVKQDIFISLNADYEEYSNVSIQSSDPSILIIKEINGGDITAQALKKGSAKIIVRVESLSMVYEIDINVFSPITSFYTTLNTYDNGVGEYEIDDDKISTKSATVEAKTTFSVLISTRPLEEKVYDLITRLYVKVAENDYQLVGEYLGAGDGVIQDGYITYNAINHSFTFYSDDAEGREYIVVYEIHNLDGAILRKQITLKCFVPIRDIMIETTTTQIYEPDSIYYGDKVLSAQDLSLRQDDPSIFGLRVNVNHVSERIPTFTFEDYGVIEIEFNGNIYNRYSVKNGVLVEEYISTLSPISALSNIMTNGYYWFRLNEDRKLSNDSLLINAYVREFSKNNFEDNKKIEIIPVSAVKSIVSNDGTDINFRQGIDNSFSANLQVFDGDIYNSELLYIPVVVLEDKFAVVQNGGLFTISINKTYENMFRLDFGLNHKFGGYGAVVIIPQDKINTLSDYTTWNSYTYTQVTVNEDSFVQGLYYIMQGEEYFLASEYFETQTYYIKGIDLSQVLSIWQGALVLNISVSDGEGIPYHISTYEELVEIGSSAESASKNYVLTRDIEIPSSYRWQAIQNYYVANVTSQEEFLLDTYYIKDGEDYVISEEYDEDATYYGLGFNGNLTGKYEIVDYRTGQTITEYYSITNVRYEGGYNSSLMGIFTKLGVDGVISDLKVEYSYFQPSTTTAGYYGGIVGENRGNIQNASVRFSDYRLTITKPNDNEFKVVVGGIAGVNYGTIENSRLLDESSLQGNLSVVLLSEDIDALVGGFAGENYGVISGSYDTDKQIEYTFNDIGFDSVLGIRVDGKSVNSRIGGVAGLNSGKIKNIALQGKIVASGLNYVGGIVGYNDVSSNREYSIERSYFAGTVSGNDFVGGVVGNSSNGSYYNISAENYATSTNSSRTFVTGNRNVGGLIGYASNVQVQFSFVVSYFGCDSIESKFVESSSSYDVIGQENVGGLAGVFVNSQVSASATYVNVRGNDAVSNFSAVTNSSSIEDAFAIGCIYAVNGVSHNPLSIAQNSYSIITDVRQGVTYTNGYEDGVINITIEDPWKASEVADNPPYLVFEGEALLSTSQIVITASVKDNDAPYTNYIKATDTALLLFYGYDEFNRYSSSLMNQVNTIGLKDLIDLKVELETHKTTRFDVRSSNLSVLTISQNGDIRVVGTGKAIITISSKLNSSVFKQIEVVVINGITGMEVYSNPSMTQNADDLDLTLVKSQSLGLYSEIEYTRQIDNQELQLLSSEQVGVRFKVYDDESLQELLQSLVDDEEGVYYELNDILRIAGNTWAQDPNGFYYVDVDYNSQISIVPQIAFDLPITISYTPYIKTVFNSGEIVTLLDMIGERFFRVTAQNGATDIVLENNILSTVDINQLEYFTFTVTVYTDYEEEDIDSNINTITDQNFGFNPGNKVINKDSNGKVVSVSRSYTVWYKDKVNTIDEEKVYNLNFWAVTNASENSLSLTIVVHGQDGVSDISARIFSDVKEDFPQKPSDSNTIYNARTGLLAFEVYPYFANYSKLRVSYSGNINYAITLTQLYYNADNTGDKFSIYTNSGTTFDENGNLIVLKTSGQDSASISTNGIYSYSRMYFFGILVPSGVPDRTSYVITIDVLDSKNNVIYSEQVPFSTLARSDLNLSFDAKFLGEDGLYYLPANTRQELVVNANTEYEAISFEISSPDYQLSEIEKEIFEPTLSDGGYYVWVMDYKNNLFSTDLIGKTIEIEAVLDDGETADPASISFVISLFTVTGVNVNNLNQGYMTLENSVTTPLTVNVEAVYDESLVNSSQNWYTTWYNNFGEDQTNSLYLNILNAGYSIEANFVDYLSQLQDSIAKANYNSSSTSTTKTSGVWLYVDSQGTLSALRSGNMYNNNAFGVENYRDYIAVYGYETDRNSNLILNVRLTYSHYDMSTSTRVKDSSGVPSVRDYNYEFALYQSNFTFEQEFTLTFVDRIGLNNPTPISSASEFLDLAEETEGDFRLVNDIELTNYTPINLNVDSFDGNNYTIYITSFSNSATNFALFDTIDSESMAYNATVYYTSRVDYSTELETIIPRAYPIEIELNQTGSYNFGGLAITNKGIITNCTVTGGVTFDTNLSLSVTNGGLVTQNSTSGFITNSKVTHFILTCYGTTGGFVAQNMGKVVASYFDNSSITNLSTANTGGFVYQNSGEIYECYAQGARSTTDNDIRNTGAGISSDGGNVGGFAYQNTSLISDCYSNILISTSNMMAGFVYVDSESSVISKCYSISCKRSGDNETTAFPFVGPSAEHIIPLRVIVNGTLNNCYYLTTGGSWEESNFYLPDSTNPRLTPANKKAEALETDDFATHDSFINYDLSLVYNTDYYEDRTQFNYIDGYTWVIVEGKPLLVSTLTNTISQQDYQGKQKNYDSEELVCFDKSSIGELHAVEQTEGVMGSNLIRTNYYALKQSGDYLDSDIIYSSLRDNNANQITYTFNPKGEFLGLSIICSIVVDENGKETYVYESAEYGDGKILDIRTNSGDVYFDSDENFRANDTIVIERNEQNNEILRITYRTLQSASYYYSSSVSGISDVLGTRTNPKIIYNAESFRYWLTETTLNKTTNTFYRIVSDINLDSEYITTSNSTFSGVLQGNYMSIENLSLSYFNNSVEAGQNSTSFGLFSSIATKKESTNDTVISNLTINVDQVLSNAHMFVGALAGMINADSTLSSKKVFLTNISILTPEGSKSLVMGKNAVGGLAGYATGNVIIKDITASVSVNASYEAPDSVINSTLYAGANTSNVSRISYAGGVVGIFDVKKVIDTATLRNYNASNIIVNGENTYVGNIVGSAFGLVGENCIINYVNASLTHSEISFIKATSYAGGLVGENRGTIISSSASQYDEQANEQNHGIGDSPYDQYDLFFSGLGGEVLAIGGLVGLNNGGLVTNSISKVNVTNKKATIAGGAVGRMLEGALENVIASGAVLGNRIMGGLVGSLNDIDLMAIEGEYNADGLIPFDRQKYIDFYGSFVAGEDTKVIISNCVAGNNWLVKDYSYYLSRINNGNALLAGFIGVISYYNTVSAINDLIFETISFTKPSFYANTLFTTVNSQNPARILQSTYLSYELDSVEVNTNSPNVLVDGNGEQVVYPYSTNEFYYESAQSKVNYTVISINNELSGAGSPNDVYAKEFYQIRQTTPSELINSEFFYTLIDYDEDGNWGTPYNQRSFDWYQDRFGYIYYLNENNSYTLVNSEQEFIALEKLSDGSFREFYYIQSPILTEFSYTEEYLSTDDSIFVYGNNLSSSSRVNAYTFESIDDLKEQTYISINGIQIPINLLDSENTISEEIFLDEQHEQFSEGTYEYKNFNLPLINGGEITSVKIYVKSYVQADNIRAYVERVQVVYEYKNVGYNTLDNENVFVSLQSTINNAQTFYDLKISSKKVIFSSFKNGYWQMDDNFLSYSLDDVSRYPVNLEFAEKYVWSDFRSTNVSTTIYTAEDLAGFAYMVNSGYDSYEGKTVTLSSDIDLSGKYWLPIGSEKYPFKGTFDGQGYSIKYVSVNENSLKDSNNLPKYAGLFGYTDGATIFDINILGGEVCGEYAGGLVAKANNTTIYNVQSRNNAVGQVSAGGIVGEMLGGSIYNTQNYARVESNSNSTNLVYVGGIVGNATDTAMGGTSGDRVLTNTNYGEIYATNNSTNYISNTLIELFVGGIAGQVNNVTLIDNSTNEGSITVTTNSDKTHIGGVVGSVVINDKTLVLSKIQNNADILVNYVNNFSDADIGESANYDDYAVMDVGGVLGVSNINGTFVNNEGNLTVNTTSSNDAKISVGGIVGRIDVDGAGGVDLRNSYNIGDIESFSTNSSVFGIGGLVGTSDLSYYENNNSDEANEKTKDKISIYDSYNAGDVLSSNNCATFIGGILGYAYGSNVVSNRVLIQRTLNVGGVSIYNIMRTQNALGAIVGIDEHIYTTNPMANTTVQDIEDYIPQGLYNFYLRGSAYASGEMYTAFSQYEPSTSYYTAVDDIPTFAVAKISDSLKDETNYQIEVVISDITYTYDTWDFDNTWEQEYDTWYPTLKNNLVTAFWVEKQQEVQSTGVSYSVNSAEELAYVGNLINTGKIESEGIVINLNSFIDLSNRFWTPIGNDDFPFKGTFNGNSYEIKNLTVEGSVLSDNTYGGLFGVVEGATITNLGFNAPVVQNVTNAGSVSALAKNSNISYIYVENGDSESSVIEGISLAGGIVGELVDSNDKSSSDRRGLYFAYNNTRVSADTEITGLSSVGGLVGSLSSSIIGNAYNGESGIVVVRDASVSTGSIVVGEADISSQLINVFNLSPLMQTIDLSDIEITEKQLYTITLSEDNRVLVVNTGYEPTFDNLVSDDDLGQTVDVFTKEYSLNSVELIDYPTIRGLGREWKNTESDNLVSYTISSDFGEKGSIVDYIQSITVDSSLSDEINALRINPTLLSFANDNNIKVNKVYLISSAQELVFLANNVNNGSLLTTNTEFILTSDIDLTGSYWTPIGLSSVYPFMGVFNFNGHVISGLTIDNSSYTYAGLFGYTKNAYIINGYLQNAFIKINNQGINSEVYAGALVGLGDNTTIKNISVSATISAYSNFASYIGGVAGYLTGSSYSVQNVKSFKGAKSVDLGNFVNNVVELEDNTEVKSDNLYLAGFSDKGSVYAGGIAGYVVGPDRQEDDFSVITYAQSGINITAVSRSASANVYAGGIAGYGAEFLTVDTSSSTSIIKTYSAKFDVAGGIVGYNNNGVVSNSQFDGYLETRQSSGRVFDAPQNIRSYVGGIVGSARGGVISNCINSGSTLASNVSEDVSIGAIIGYAIDKEYTGDSLSIYYTGNNGFEDAIGIYVYEVLTQPSDIQDLINGVYTNDTRLISAEGSPFRDNPSWKVNGSEAIVLSNKVFLMGANMASFRVSYGGETKPLLGQEGVDSQPGLLVDLENLGDVDIYNIATSSSESKIAVSLLVQGVNGLEYYYIEQTLSDSADETFKLSTVIGSTLKSQLVTCFISYLE